MSEPVNIHAYEQAARAALHPDIFDCFAGGAGDEITLAEDLEAFRRTFLRPRVLVDVSECAMATSALLDRACLAVTIAPLAYLRVARAEGELAVAPPRGARLRRVQRLEGRRRHARADARPRPWRKGILGHWLASLEASYMNGSVVTIDGGRIA
jgi:hypothetical protein